MKLLTLLAASAFIPFAAMAQPAFPSKTVRIVIGVPPGGLSDNVARALGAELARRWGQPIVVENRLGAADAVAAEAVLKSAADGHTVYQTNGSVLMINQLLRKNLPFNVERDFAPVLGIARISNVVVVRSTLEVKTVKDLVELARAKPNALNYGSLGVGSGTHLFAERLGLMADVRMTHIPYKGGTDVGKALLSGEIDFAFNGLISVLGLIRQGRLRAIAWASPQRSPLIPDVPTMDEAGYGFETGGWLGWFVASATPRGVVDRISADAGRVLAQPDFRDKHVVANGMEPLNLPLPGFAGLIRDTRASYAEVLSKVPLKLE